MVTVPDGGTVKVLETLRDDTKSQQQKTNSTHATLRVYSMSDIMSCVHAHVTHACLSQYECKRNAHTHLTAPSAARSCICMYMHIYICTYYISIYICVPFRHSGAYADVCRRMLTSADVCRRMLTYADVC